MLKRENHAISDAENADVSASSFCPHIFGDICFNGSFWSRPQMQTLERLRRISKGLRGIVRDELQISKQ